MLLNYNPMLYVVDCVDVAAVGIAQLWSCVVCCWLCRCGSCWHCLIMILCCVADCVDVVAVGIAQLGSCVVCCWCVDVPVLWVQLHKRLFHWFWIHWDNLPMYAASVNDTELCIKYVSFTLCIIVNPAFIATLHAVVGTWFKSCLQDSTANIYMCFTGSKLVRFLASTYVLTSYHNVVYPADNNCLFYFITFSYLCYFLTC